MRYRRLGRTGFDVSEISLGTVEIGMPYGIGEDGAAPPPEEAETSKLLHNALDLGVNLIDTARAYGESEAIIGRVLRDRRREFILVSKVSSYQDQHLDSAALRKRITSSVHQSLSLLQTDVIDVMMIHSAPTEVIESGEAGSILRDIKRQGHIRAVGASVYGEEAALAAIADGDRALHRRLGFGALVGVRARDGEIDRRRGGQPLRGSHESLCLVCVIGALGLAQQRGDAGQHLVVSHRPSD